MDILFPNGFGIKKGLWTTLLWAIMLIIGLSTIKTAFIPLNYSSSPEVRAFLGCITVYTAINALYNKLIAYGKI